MTKKIRNSNPERDLRLPEAAQDSWPFLSRRSFLRRAALGSAGLVLGGPAIARSRTLSPNAKLNLAVIGVAHRGGENLKEVTSENIVALCDVDDQFLGAAAQKHPGAKTY